MNPEGGWNGPDGGGGGVCEPNELDGGGNDPSDGMDGMESVGEFMLPDEGNCPLGERISPFEGNCMFVPRGGDDPSDPCGGRAGAPPWVWTELSSGDPD